MTSGNRYTSLDRPLPLGKVTGQGSFREMLSGSEVPVIATGLTSPGQTAILIPPWVLTHVYHWLHQNSEQVVFLPMRKWRPTKVEWLAQGHTT